MPVDFITKTVNLPTRNPQGSTREFSYFTEHTFGRRIRKAETVLNGFNLRYTRDVRPFNVMQVDTDAIIDNATRGTVSARIQIKLADNNYDDPFTGWVTVVIFVEYE